MVNRLKPIYGNTPFATFAIVAFAWLSNLDTFSASEVAEAAKLAARATHLRAIMKRQE